MTATQKFHKGDLVQVANDLGPSMAHFKAGCRAIVIGSYADQYGGSSVKDYTLHLEGGLGRTSWYHEHQLTLISHDRMCLLELWQKEAEEEIAVRSDLNWIFSHGEEVLEKGYGASVSALARCFGVTNLWGSRGEGITHYINSLRTLAIAEPYLRSGDKDGYVAYCTAFLDVKQP